MKSNVPQVAKTTNGNPGNRVVVQDDGLKPIPHNIAQSRALLAQLHDEIGKLESELVSVSECPPPSAAGEKEPLSNGLLGEIQNVNLAITGAAERIQGIRQRLLV